MLRILCMLIALVPSVAYAAPCDDAVKARIAHLKREVKAAAKVGDKTKCAVDARHLEIVRRELELQHALESACTPEEAAKRSSCNSACLTKDIAAREKALKRFCSR